MGRRARWRGFCGPGSGGGRGWAAGDIAEQGFYEIVVEPNGAVCNFVPHHGLPRVRRRDLVPMQRLHPRPIIPAFRHRRRPRSYPRQRRSLFRRWRRRRQRPLFRWRRRRRRRGFLRRRRRRRRSRGRRRRNIGNHLLVRRIRGVGGQKRNFLAALLVLAKAMAAFLSRREIVFFIGRLF